MGRVGHERGGGEERRQRHRTNGRESEERRMKSEGLANGGEKKEKEKERREEKRKKKGGRGIVGERGGPNLVEEDCFHSVLKLKRSEDRRPRFESRLSAGDNQTGGDLFSPSLSSPSSPLFHLPFARKRRKRQSGGDGKKRKKSKVVT